jgi:hypothetical protein
MEEDHMDDEENQEEEDVWGGSDEEVRVHLFLFLKEYNVLQANNLA